MQVLHNIQKIILFFGLTFFLILPSFAFADSNLTGKIDYTPANPKPFDTVTMTLKSFSFEVDASNISWYINTILIKKGQGEKTFTFPLGEANKPFFVGANVVTPTGEVFQTSTKIIPHFTPLLTEALEGYTPPFYEGRALHGEGAKVRVVAYPLVSEAGELIDKKDLVYKWQVNTVPFVQASGLGKNSFIVRQDELEEENTVVVNVTSQTGESVLQERTSLKPYELAPLFYLYDPLFGIDLSKAFETEVSIIKPIKLFYSPYNFAYSKQNTYFNWSLNGLPISTDTDFLVSLIPTLNSKGSNTLNLTVSSDKKQLQNLDSSITINFDTTQSNESSR